MYLNGLNGLSPDDTEALKWFRLAADQGHAQAQANLGYMYANGRAVPRDLAQAAFWYRKAIAEGIANAQNNLANFYLNGEGPIQQDEGEARRLYELAALQGVANSQFNLGIMLLNGRGGPADHSEAIRWLKAAAGQNEERARIQLKKLGVRW